MGTVNLVVPGVKVIGSRVNVPVEIKASVVVMDINIKTSTIMVPIDLQGAYIMMPVDIQAQYITLDIDIVAQTVGNIGIDIKAQTVGNITINLSAQSVGIYLQPEWAAKTGVDKEFWAVGFNVISGSNIHISYAVPSGKTLYITFISASQVPNASGEQTALEMFYGYALIGSNYHITFGGNLGAFLPLAKPLAVAGGSTVYIYQVNQSGHNSDMRLSANGYEI